MVIPRATRVWSLTLKTTGVTAQRRIAFGVGYVARNARDLHSWTSTLREMSSLRHITVPTTLKKTMMSTTTTIRAASSTPQGGEEGPSALVAIEKLLRDALAPVTLCEVADRFGDGKMLEVAVSSPLLDGKPRVRQHQAVYRALGPYAAQFHAIQVRVVPSTPTAKN